MSSSTNSILYSTKDFKTPIEKVLLAMKFTNLIITSVSTVFLELLQYNYISLTCWLYIIWLYNLHAKPEFSFSLLIFSVVQLVGSILYIYAIMTFVFWSLYKNDMFSPTVKNTFENEVINKCAYQIISNRIARTCLYSELQERPYDICPITQEAFTDSQMVTQIKHCKHTFTPDWIQLWFEKNATCPICRVWYTDVKPAHNCFKVLSQ